MKPRDRVQMALQHIAPDRCPMSAGFTPEFRNRLRKELIDRGMILNDGQNAYEIERAVGVDMLLTFVGWALSYYQEGDTYTDDWGIRWKSMPYHTQFGIGHYTEMIEHPLSDEAAVTSYQPPDPNRPALYAETEQVLSEFQDEYWMVGSVVCTILEAAWGLRGLEALLVDFISNPDLAREILNIPYQYHLQAARKLTKMGVDMIWIGDDVGAQHAMLISPTLWRKFLKPLMANFIAELKTINPNVKVAYHSDGNIYPIIGDLIDIGLDVLNPIQPGSMDPAQLKKEFGERLCFWGTIDVQHTLPFGTVDDVRAEVLERLSTMGKNGGLILGPTHYVQLDTPMKNFWTMIDTIQSTPYDSIRF